MSEWKNTEIGIIPKNAEVRELEDCINLVIDHRGKTPNSCYADRKGRNLNGIK